MISLFRKTPIMSKTSASAQKLSSLYQGDRGLLDLRANDAELRVWIPEPLKVAMTETAKRHDEPLSTYVREFFITYLYGAHELLCMRDNQTGIFYEPPPTGNTEKAESPVMFSRPSKVDYIPGLGKNIVPYKLFLNEKIKSDLMDLAERNGIPLSQFVREILVSHFLGHSVWPQRILPWTSEQQKLADDWAEGRTQESSMKKPDTQEEFDAIEGKIERL